MSVRKTLDTERLPRCAAMLSLLGALLLLLLSMLAGVDVLVAEVRTTVNLDESVRGPTISITHGYLPEINHAVLSIAITPIFVWFGTTFLRSVGSAADTLVRQGRLDSNAASWIAGRNRRFFMVAGPALAIICVLWNLNHELHARERARTAIDLETVELGHVQGPFIDRWADLFNASTSTSQFDEIRSFGDAERRLAGFIERRIALRREYGPTKERWAGLLLDPQTGSPLDARDAIEPGQFQVDLRRAVQTGLVTLTAGNGLEKNAVDGWRYRIFFLTFVALSTIFYFFSAYVALKICFWFVVLSRLPLDGPVSGTASAPSIRLVPWLDDPQSRYGLIALDRPNKDALRLILLGGLCVCSMILSQDPKGQYLASMSHGLAQFGALIGVVIPLLFLVGQTGVMNARLQRVRDAAVDRLAVEVEASRTPERKAILERMGVVATQSFWPGSDPAFRLMFRATLIIAVLPTLLLLGLLPEIIRESLDVLHAVRHFATEAGHWLAGYGAG